MEILESERRIAPVYNKLVIAATNTYLNAEPIGLSATERSAWRKAHPTIDTTEMTGKEFETYILESNRQPINPVSAARRALKLPEGTPEHEVAEGLRQAYRELVQQYQQNNIDPSPLALVWEIISLTEAYISGYSREIGGIALKLESINSTYNGLTNWNGGLWVPDEDAHDHTLGWVATHVGMLNQEDYFRKHSRHLKIGNHVDLSSFISANNYVALQEDSTEISYHNAAQIFGPVFGAIFTEIGQNEAQHKRAYKFIHLGLMQEFPDETVLSMEQNCNSFEMPGKEGIEGYKGASQALGYIGILYPEAIIKSQKQLIKSMGLETADLQTDEAKSARDKLLAGTNRGAKLNKKLAALAEIARNTAIEEAKKEGTILPMIIGKTVTAHPKTHELTFPRAA